MEFPAPLHVDDPGTVLVSVDLGEAEAALAVAEAGASLAGILGLDLTLMAVVPPLQSRHVLHTGGKPLVEHVRGRAMLEAMAVRLGRNLSGVRVKVIQDEEITSAIVCEAEVSSAALVVVGTHGRSGLARAATGSIAEELVRSCSRPVLVVRNGGPRPIHRRLSLARILVATDFAPPANDAVVAAGVLAKATGARLHLITVEPGGRHELIGDTRDELTSGAVAHAPHRLWQTVSALREDGVDAHGWVAHGVPAKRISEAVSELLPGLVVIGTQARRGMGRLLQGSAATAVLRAAQVPVLVVRDGTALPSSLRHPASQAEARP